MPIPDFQSLMLPVLKSIERGETSTKDSAARIADQFRLTSAERAQRLPSGRQTVIGNRVAWAIAYLMKAGLVSRLGRGVYALTDAGRRVLNEDPKRIDIAFLRQFESFRAFRDERPESTKSQSALTDDAEGVATPEERLLSAHEEMEAQLSSELIGRIMSAPPEFFENLILDIMRRIGYGGGRPDALSRTGGTGDGGIDGIINEDALGLDVIYVQGKRYQPDSPIGEEKIRDFSGALTLRGATKGVFVTTSYFTKAALTAAASIRAQRIILIDGARLAQLMISNDVGVRVERNVSVKRIDLDYFEGDGSDR